MKHNIPFTIRPMRRADVPAVVRMMKGLAAHHDETTPTTAKHFLTYALGPKKLSHIWVAVLDKNPVGFIEFHYGMNFRRGLFAVRVDYFFVEEKLRGHGIGLRLLQEVMKAALAKGCSFFSVAADPKNKKANAFYKGIGLTSRELRRFDYLADKKVMQAFVAHNKET